MLSFYGNVSSRPQSAFMFDRIYTTRKAMDENAASDGIFVGRYVLVDYGNPMMEGYYKSADGKFYADEDYQIELSKIENALYKDKTASGTSTEGQIYQYAYAEVPSGETGETGETGEPVKAWQFIVYSGGSAPTDYQATDIAKYGRGFDSTVWVKTATGKYVLVAELAPSIPEFEIKANPPTITPVAPYFDKNTTNQNYIMRVQGQYGARIANAEVMGETGNTSYLSDENINYNKMVYGETTGWTSELHEQEPGAIYYNKDGFNKNISVHAETGIPNEIIYGFTSSGLNYYESGSTTGTTDDTMAWRIYLPVIGDMIADAWDMLYGTQAGQTEGTLIRQTDILSENISNINNCSFVPTSIVGIGNTMRAFLGTAQNANDWLATSITGVTENFTINTDNVITITGESAETTVRRLNKRILYLDNNNTRSYYAPTYTYNSGVTGGSAEVPNSWYYSKIFDINLSTIDNPGLKALETDEELGTAQTLLGAIAEWNKLVGKAQGNNYNDMRTITGLMNVASKSLAFGPNLNVNHFITVQMTDQNQPIIVSTDYNINGDTGTVLTTEGWQPRVAQFTFGESGLVVPSVGVSNPGTIGLTSDGLITLSTNDNHTLAFQHYNCFGNSEATWEINVTNNNLRMPQFYISPSGHITELITNTFLYSSDKIKFKKDESLNISVEHTLSGVTAGTYPASLSTNAVMIPQLTVDETGHISSIMMVGSNLVNYKLTGYTGLPQSKTSITANDTLGAALLAIEEQINLTNIDYTDIAKNFNVSLNNTIDSSKVTFTNNNSTWEPHYDHWGETYYVCTQLKTTITFTGAINSADTYDLIIKDSNSNPVASEENVALPIENYSVKSASGQSFSNNSVFTLYLKRHFAGLDGTAVATKTLTITHS